MNIDVILAAPNAPVSQGPNRVVVASSAQRLVQLIVAALGAGGQIDRLRIVDAFSGPAHSHPLTSFAELGALRQHFAPGGSVEIVAGPAASAQGEPTVPGMSGRVPLLGASARETAIPLVGAPAGAKSVPLVGAPARETVIPLVGAPAGATSVPLLGAPARETVIPLVGAPAEPGTVTAHTLNPVKLTHLSAVLGVPVSQV